MGRTHNIISPFFLLGPCVNQLTKISFEDAETCYKGVG